MTVLIPKEVIDTEVWKENDKGDPNGSETLFTPYISIIAPLYQNSVLVIPEAIGMT